MCHLSSIFHFIFSRDGTEATVPDEWVSFHVQYIPPLGPHLVHAMFDSIVSRNTNKYANEESAIIGVFIAPALVYFYNVVVCFEGRPIE